LINLESFLWVWECSWHSHLLFAYIIIFYFLPAVFVSPWWLIGRGDGSMLEKSTSFSISFFSCFLLSLLEGMVLNKLFNYFLAEYLIIFVDYESIPATFVDGYDGWKSSISDSFLLLRGCLLMKLLMHKINNLILSTSLTSDLSEPKIEMEQ